MTRSPSGCIRLHFDGPPSPPLNVNVIIECPKSDKGYFHDVDIQYLENLHNLLNDLSF